MIEAADFLAFAKNMDRENETDDRVCISRAYYAAMHRALEYAKKEGYQHSSKEAGGTHGNLIFYFERNPTEKHLSIASMLKKLKFQRQKADYRLIEAVYSYDADKALKIAQTIFSDLS